MGMKRAQRAIADSELPQSITRDTEFISADNAHAEAVDPHTQYANQARGDARYGAIKKIVFFGTTAASQEGSAVIPHQLSMSKIMAVSALVEVPGALIDSRHVKSAGHEFDLSVNGTAIYVGNIATRSFNILSKPVRIVVDYLMI